MLSAMPFNIESQSDEGESRGGRIPFVCRKSLGPARAKSRKEFICGVCLSHSFSGVCLFKSKVEGFTHAHCACAM